MKKLLVVGLLIALCIVVSPVWAEATIWTDKEDYYPWETVSIRGSGFSAGTVEIFVTWPDMISYQVLPPAVAGDDGYFSAEYSLTSGPLGYGLEGLYTITAKDESGQTASTIFTDGNIGTSTVLDPISTPLIAGDTYSFSGQVISDDSSNPVPSGQNVQIQFNGITIGTTTTGLNGIFSGTFTAPIVGTYDVRAHFPSTGSVPGYTEKWQQSQSEEQPIEVQAEVVSNSAPEITVDNDPVTVDEGSTASNTGTVFDPDDDSVILSASVGGVTNNNDGTWSWSFATTDGPDQSQTVTITADDDNGGVTTTTFSLTVNNVAPTATFNAPTSVDEGSDIALSLTDPSDPSSADTAAGFEYAFDCGAGYGSWSSTSTATCPTTDNGVVDVKGKIRDKDGGFTEYTASVTVNNVAPDITDLSLSATTINENEETSLSGSFADPGTLDTHTVEIDWGDGSTNTTVNLAANVLIFGPISHQYLDDPAGTPDDYTISVTVTDKDTASDSDTTTVTVNNVDPTVGAISIPLDPVKIGDPVSVSVPFTDPGTLDTHTAVWDWDDTTTSAGTVTELDGSGTVSGSHSYSTPGIYTISVTVTDKDGGVGTSTATTYVVIYDPNGGFVTGGGWINSPAGAYVADPTMTGKANFGFVSKYKKGSTTPEGETEFQFKAGNLNFHSSSYDWLVVAGSKAIYKGEGTINGAGNYGFMLSAIDGSKGNPDKFRIKIWNNDAIVYDNQVSIDKTDNADPTTEIAGGSIVVHK